MWSQARTAIRRAVQAKVLGSLPCHPFARGLDDRSPELSLADKLDLYSAKNRANAAAIEALKEETAQQMRQIKYLTDVFDKSLSGPFAKTYCVLFHGSAILR